MVENSFYDVECFNCGKTQPITKSTRIVLYFKICEECFDNDRVQEIEEKLKSFMKEIIQPERLNEEDARNSICESLSSDYT
jgi:hypothetical protein